MKKSFDRRWLKLVAEVKWLAEYKDGGDATEFLERLEKYTKLLDQMAADQSLSSDDRAAVQGILDAIKVHARAHLPEALRALAHIAQLDDTAPDIREQARRMLENATHQLPAISEKLQ
jgi:uncharacterized protein (UPF0147 family)